jgi:hypothetical protein
VYLATSLYNVTISSDIQQQIDYSILSTSNNHGRSQGQG